MKVVLLAGGKGTRISEESSFKPKPMIEIGGMPILWHIMKEYSWYGYHEFIICAGYKQHMIKEWFSNYYLHSSDVTYDMGGGGKVIIHDQHTEPWKVTVVDTGLETMTGGRIRRIQKYVGAEPFMLTYGDGVCDVDISDLVRYHKAHGKKATITSVMRTNDKGALDIGYDKSVRSFREKRAKDSYAINAGYMVCEPAVFDYLTGNDSVFEKDVLEQMASEGELMSYEHTGFWQCMDSLYEKNLLEQLWEAGKAAWKKW